ncbi:flagellar assembly protein FliH [Bowmanella yangjiangensis]|uniref:Flagellar assembly protein FliH n=1 Tax=Bowmanella yangjiangensis TaxID=2811230 RepID=A0ABS3CVW6_9ALTE|nr:flagellar assembly protein FliH [Bowmanella yangjiangensis]MBN7820465.1 flagellar assembly protein FliH [Bowmanella yangjiangensis]
MSGSKILKYQTQEAGVRSWDLPFMEEAQPQPADKTNAINRSSEWKYEPPEVEEEILPPTAEEIEAIRQSAYQEGLEEGRQAGHEQGLLQGREQGLAEGREQGLAEGHAEGLEAGRQEVEQAAAIWQELANKLTKPVSQVDDQLENELVQLAVSLARAVIRTEIQTNEDVLLQAISEGLKVLPIEERRYQMHMHPDDVQLIKQHFSVEHIEAHHWQFIESPNMQRGGCDIVTDTNAVDVSIERRVRQVLDKFLLEQGLSKE